MNGDFFKKNIKYDYFSVVIICLEISFIGFETLLLLFYI